MYKLIEIKESTRKDKKMMAVFFNKKTNRNNTVHFGARGMSDYTIHKDPERKQRYLQRHKTNENWDDPVTAGALSRWILWNKKSLRNSIADYTSRFW